MAANDYEICCGMFSAYISKKRNKKSNTMSSDRVAIDENTILMLIDWYVDNYKNTNDGATEFYFNSHANEGKTIHICLEDNKTHEGTDGNE